MNIEFLGGGNEVGASCTLYQSGGISILIDAGIRMGSASLGGLPAELAFLWQGKDPSEEIVKALKTLLDQDNPFFAPDPKLPYGGLLGMSWSFGSRPLRLWLNDCK